MSTKKNTDVEPEQETATENKPEKKSILFPIDPYRDDQEETFTNNGKVIRITRGVMTTVDADDYDFLAERIEAEQRYYNERRKTQADHSVPDDF